MTDSFCLSAVTSLHHLNLLLLLGIAVFGGTVGARVFRRLHIPQIIGYIIIGLIIGESGLNLVSEQVIRIVEPFNYFALGIIGFMIGGELKFDIFRKYGKQFITILLAEGIAAFIFVGVSVGILSYVFTGNIKLSVALGVVLGAISSATDPASTIQVLWEYKTRGVLTTAAVAIVALDDALALSLYAIGTSLAGVLTGHEGAGLLAATGAVLYELTLALAVGAAAGFVLKMILMKISDRDNELTFTVGAVLLAIGLSVAMKVDIILSSMMLGLTLVNAAPRRSTETFDVVKAFAPPIYVLFFVFVGARLKISGMSYLVWSLVAAYVLGRSIGKISGATLGAVWSKADSSVRRYLGLCLFAQGGVAIGLSILASQRFDKSVSAIVILVVAATTFIVQLIGPLFVKGAVKKAGEIGLNVTEDDLIKSYKVTDLMETKAAVISAGMSLSDVVKIVSTTDGFYYPVVDGDGMLLGGITLSGIRNTFATQELNNWLVALDIMEPVIAKASPSMPLADAFELARRSDIEHLPVTVSSQNNRFAGVLDCRAVHRALSAEVLARQHKADSEPGGAKNADSGLRGNDNTAMGIVG